MKTTFSRISGMTAAQRAPLADQFDKASRIAVAEPVYRCAGVLHLDWWYDTRRVGDAMAESLADGLTIALMKLTREAIADNEIDLASEELALVDLSSIDNAVGEANGQHR